MLPKVKIFHQGNFWSIANVACSLPELSAFEVLIKFVERILFSFSYLLFTSLAMSFKYACLRSFIPFSVTVYL